MNGAGNTIGRSSTSKQTGGFNAWLLAVILIGACVLIVVSFLGGRHRAQLELVEVQSQLDDLQNLMDTQNLRLDTFENALNQERADSDHDAFQESGLFPTGFSDPSVERLAEMIATSTITQSNVLVLVGRLMERGSGALAPAVSLDHRRAAYQSLQVTAENNLGRLNLLRQETADLLFELQVPDDVAPMDADAALDTLSFSSYWPYFESKRRRDNLQRITDSIEMKLVQEQMNISMDEARANGGD